ncbi:hypothetical protein PJ985_03205 [Streptomyces sp. ACA25]|uniref:hypothetical protein n=1 Tax=Streptomyces sp. ACA25 TaxID=3022596 RepID=UPI002307A0FB|nr:hypothetical protein [Streptomyces sp. ACA25]MDB1086574.1 hypothetical protein [Streptomyces sp. ACA25]
MAQKRQPVFDRQVAIRGAHALIQPSWPLPPGRRRPVAVFEGGHGSGKTILLDTIAARVEQWVPYGRVDFTETQYDDIPHTLSVLAGRLARYRPRYRRLRFPRLLIALLVLEQDLSLHDFEQARKAVSQLLRERRSGSWPQRFLAEITGEPMEVDLRWGVMVSVLRLPLNTVAALAGHTFTSRSQRWFGHRDRGLNDQAEDTLVELNTWAREAREDPDGPRARGARDRVAGLLCEAFLADLRDCPRRVHRLQTPLLLLDNVDTTSGRAFLRQFVEAAPPLAAEDRAEPLTVIATCQDPTAGLGEGPVLPLEDVVRGSGGDSPGDHPAWLRYRLPDLDRGDVQTLMNSASGHGRVDRRLARLVHEFTAGHPATAGLLTAAAADLPHPASSVSELLRQPLPYAGGFRSAEAPGAAGARTVEEGLLRLLLPAEDSKVDAFVSCSAARTAADGLWLSHQSDLVDAAWADGVRRTAPWSPGGRAGETVLRRLLLRRLAVRSPADPADWTTVHLRLRGFCRKNEDLAGELYHRLAADDLTTVALEFARLLPEMAGQDWLDLLQAASEAPSRRIGRSLEQPYTLFHELVDEAAVASADVTTTRIVHLLAALRIVNDPSGGVAREFLHTQIAGTLSALAPHSPHGLVVLHRAAAEYEQQAQWWT